MQFAASPHCRSEAVCTPVQPSAIWAGWGPLSQFRRVRPHTRQPTALDNSCHQPAAWTEAGNVIGCVALANQSTGGETDTERSVIGKQRAGEMLICHCSFCVCVCASVPVCLIQVVLKMIKAHRKGHRGRKEARKCWDVHVCGQPETNTAASKHSQSFTWSELAALTRITATIFIPIWPCQSQILSQDRSALVGGWRTSGCPLGSHRSGQCRL